MYERNIIYKVVFTLKHRQLMWEYLARNLKANIYFCESIAFEQVHLFG